MADNFDQFFPDWTTGMLTIASGSKNFTATNAQLNIAPVRAGDTIITPSGLSLIIATINANGNGGTLFYNAPPAAAGTFQTCIRFQSDNSRYTGAVAALVKLATGGNLFSLAGLQGGADKMPIFTGTGTLDVTALTLFARTLLAADSASAAYGVLGEVPDARISETLPQSKSYRRGNVIGTVSQSGGVPTGYLMQPGSNANGGFVKFADGTQICWINQSASRLVTLTTAVGSSFRGAMTWTFPAAFAGNPVPSGSLNEYRGGSIANAAITSTYVNLVPMAAVQMPEGAQWNAIAIGRWF